MNQIPLFKEGTGRHAGAVCVQVVWLYGGGTSPGSALSITFPLWLRSVIAFKLLKSPFAFTSFKSSGCLHLVKVALY